MQKLRENAGRMHDFWCVMRRVAIQFFGCVVAIFASGRTHAGDVDYGAVLCYGDDTESYLSNNGGSQYQWLNDIGTGCEIFGAHGKMAHCVPNVEISLHNNKCVQKLQALGLCDLNCDEDEQAKASGGCFIMRRDGIGGTGAGLTCEADGASSGSGCIIRYFPSGVDDNYSGNYYEFKHAKSCTNFDGGWSVFQQSSCNGISCNDSPDGSAGRYYKWAVCYLGSGVTDVRCGLFPNKDANNIEVFSSLEAGCNVLSNSSNTPECLLVDTSRGNGVNTDGLQAIKNCTTNHALGTHSADTGRAQLAVQCPDGCTWAFQQNFNAYRTTSAGGHGTGYCKKDGDYITITAPAREIALIHEYCNIADMWQGGNAMDICKISGCDYANGYYISISQPDVGTMLGQSGYPICTECTRNLYVSTSGATGFTGVEVESYYALSPEDKEASGLSGAQLCRAKLEKTKYSGTTESGSFTVTVGDNSGVCTHQ